MQNKFQRSFMHKFAFCFSHSFSLSFSFIRFAWRDTRDKMAQIIKVVWPPPSPVNEQLNSYSRDCEWRRYNRHDWSYRQDGHDVLSKYVDEKLCHETDTSSLDSRVWLLVLHSRKKKEPSRLETENTWQRKRLKIVSGKSNQSQD